jgi:hypothetical protein
LLFVLAFQSVKLAKFAIAYQKSATTATVEVLPSKRGTVLRVRDDGRVA